jgi:hypothetical protein
MQIVDLACSMPAIDQQTLKPRLRENPEAGRGWRE